MNAQKFSKIKLVVTDLDGTFLADDKTIPLRNFAVVKKLQERGIHFSVASGRMYGMFETYIKQLGLTIPVIACDGAMIHSGTDGSVIASHKMAAAAAQAILDYAAAEKMDYITYAGNQVYFIHGSKRIGRFLHYNEIARRSGDREIAICYYQKNHRDLAQMGIVKILIIESDGNAVAKMKNFLAGFRQIDSCMPEAAALDILAAGSSKGQAVKWLADSLGIDQCAVCTVGDCLNDLSMIKAAGVSVAMGNAFPEIKQAATVTTDTNDNAGFAQAMERYILS